MQALDTVGTPAPLLAAPRRPARRWAGLSAVVAGAGFITRRTERERLVQPTMANSAPQKSLAALPFNSVGGDTTNAYFAEGIADELTTALSRSTRISRGPTPRSPRCSWEPYYFDMSMTVIIPRARAAAERAVALDDALPEAHLALGHVHTETYEWKDAESERRRAMALDPNHAKIPFRLGFMLVMSGRVHEAIPAFEQAKAVDPLYSVPVIYLAWALALVGRNTEAVAEARRALDLNSTNEAIGNVYANALAVRGGDLVLAQAINSPPFDSSRGNTRFAAVMRRFDLDLSRVTAPGGGRSR